MAFLEIGFFVGVVLIYLVTQKTRFWLDFPIVHFFIWLGAIAIFILLSIGLSPTNAEIARSFSINFGFLIILTLIFWVILGLDVVLLGVNIGRWFTTKAFRFLPFPIITAFTIFILLVRPMLALLASLWLKDGFWLLDLVFSVPLILWAGIVSLTKRWTSRNSASLLSLSLASPIVVLGISLAFAGTDPLEALLNLTGLFSASFLFVGLTAYNIFSSGTDFTRTDGEIMPRKARILMYFGVLILVVTFMLFLSNEHLVETGEVVGTMQTVIDGTFAFSALFIGIPYIIWMVIKKREAIIGDEDNLNKAPDWALLKIIPGYWIVILSIGVALLVSCCLGFLILFQSHI